MAKFRLLRPGVKKLLNEPGCKKWCGDAAREVAAEARRTAPVRTGHYKRSISSEVLKDSKGYFGHVKATDFKAMWVEHGTNGIRKSRVLGTALDVIGPSAKIKGPK